MSKVIIFGHGGFDSGGGTGPPMVLVPPGTTLQFYSDAGQALVLPARGDNTDYNKVIQVWDHFQPTESAIPEKWVTYNYSVAPEDHQEERDLAMSLDWGGQVVSPALGSADFYLCTGTEDTCPTPALRVQQQNYDRDGEGDPVEDDKWNHHCQGILKQYAGNDIHWVACTSFEMETPQVPALMLADATGPGATSTAGWIPDDTAIEEAQDLNKQNIKDADDGATLTVAVGGVLLMVGDGHNRRAGDYVRRQQDLEEGEITVNKGGVFSKGSFEVTGISAKQDLVRTLLKDFSDKKVTFS